MTKTIEEINKEKKESEQKIKDIQSKKNTINNELAHAVHIIRKKYPEKLKIFEEVKNAVFKEEPEETEKYNFDKEGFDEGGLHKDTGAKYNSEGFDKEGFDKEGLHKDTKNKYNPNGFDKYG